MTEGYIKEIMRKYIFLTTVIGCAVIFCCGTLTARQKTAYNIWLEKYSVMSMTNTSRSVDVSIDGKAYSLPLPDKIKKEGIADILKLTPLAPAVFLVEVISGEK